MFIDYFMYIGKFMYIVEVSIVDGEENPVSLTIADEKRNKTMTIVLDWDAPSQIHDLAEMVMRDGDVDDHSEDL